MTNFVMPVRQSVVVPEPPPECRGPLAHTLPLASTTLIKNVEAQERLTVQLSAGPSDVMLYGGCSAGAT